MQLLQCRHSPNETVKYMGENLKMYSLLSVVSIVLFGVWNSALANGHDKRIDMNACYGDTLELSLIESFNADGTPNRLLFALPSPAAWVLRPKGFDTTLDFSPCQPEPIMDTKAWGGFMDSRLGHADASEIGGELFGLVRTIRLRSVLKETYDAHRRLGQMRKKHPELYEVEDGFRKIVGDKPEDYPGLYIAPEGVVSPDGYPLWFSCGLGKSCNVTYRLKGNIVIRYNFWTRDTELIDWIELDKVVQKTILGWVIEQQ